MSTQTPPKKDPLSSLFVQSAQPPDPAEGLSDTPEPGHLRATRPVSRPMPPPIIPPAPSAGPDPRALAKALAKAAVAKAGAAAPRPSEERPKAEAKAAPAPKPAESKPVIRGVAAAPPPTRKLSALEAMEAARKQEAAPPKAAAAAAKPAAASVAAPAAAPAVTLPAPPPPPQFSAPEVAAPAPPRTAPVLAQSAAPTVSEEQLGDVVQSVLGSNLPGAQVYVANAMFAEDRKTLTALWRSHRARFLATHQVEYAVGASMVLHHLARSAPNQLAVAHGVTDKGEFLLWVDLDARVLLTAFANPRQLVTGW